MSGDDLETLRKRRATANRVWATLRAALNQAFKNGRVESDAAWRRITPYRSVNAPKIRFFDPEETAKLIRHCPVEFRPMVRAALYTGARYGELCRLRVGDFQNGSLRIERSKSGRPRTRVLVFSTAYVLHVSCRHCTKPIDCCTKLVDIFTLLFYA